jgi:hypothetical protein
MSAMLMRAIRVLIAALAAAAALPAQAQISVSSTMVGVPILGGIYDVTFIQGNGTVSSFDLVYGVGSSPVLLFDASNAQAAAQAILSASNARDFDITPGASDAANEVFIMPYAYTATTFDFYAGWADTAGNIFSGVTGPFPGRSRISARQASFLSITVSAVPEPPSVLLSLLGGAVVLGWAAHVQRASPSRRRSRAASGR